jgi:hypothetical protein
LKWWREASQSLAAKTVTDHKFPDVAILFCRFARRILPLRIFVSEIDGLSARRFLEMIVARSAALLTTKRRRCTLAGRHEQRAGQTVR